MKEPIAIESSVIYVTPSGVKVTGELLDQLFQRGVTVRFEHGPEQSLLPSEDKIPAPHTEAP